MNKNIKLYTLILYSLFFMCTSTVYSMDIEMGELPVPLKYKVLTALGTGICAVATTCAAVATGIATTELFKHHPNIRSDDYPSIPGYIAGANVLAAGICIGGICYCKIKDRLIETQL